MHRRKINHRRIRNLLNKIFGLFFIFFITLICLAGIFFIVKNQQKKLLNPLSISLATNDLLTTQNTTNSLQSLLQKNNIDTDTISVASDSSILAKLKTGQEIIFSQNKNAKEQIASLQLIMSRLTIEGKRFNRIDFRFDNPVITF